MFTDSTSYINQIIDVHVDRPLNTKHPKHGFVYKVNYGFIPNTKSQDEEELDAYVLGVNEPLQTFHGRCVAVIHRTNDNDDKLVVIPLEMKDISDEEIRKQTYFQEQFFESIIVRDKK